MSYGRTIFIILLKLSVLQINKLRLNSKKCEFEKHHLVYLGLIVDVGKIQKNPEKGQVISQWPNYTVKVILFQDGKPIAYHSETFSGLVLNYPTNANELYVLHQAIESSFIASIFSSYKSFHIQEVRFQSKDSFILLIVLSPRSFGSST